MFILMICSDSVADNELASRTKPLFLKLMLSHGKRLNIVCPVGSNVSLLTTETDNENSRSFLLDGPAFLDMVPVG
jgi:hypothetical protein